MLLDKGESSAITSFGLSIRPNSRESKPELLHCLQLSRRYLTPERNTKEQHSWFLCNRKRDTNFEVLIFILPCSQFMCLLICDASFCKLHFWANSSLGIAQEALLYASTGIQCPEVWYCSTLNLLWTNSVANAPELLYCFENRVINTTNDS